MTSLYYNELTYWGRVTHICVGKLTIIGSYNGLSPGRRQAIIWTNAGILLIGSWTTKPKEILIAIHIFSFKKMHLKMSSGKWQPCCLGLSALMLLGTGEGLNGSTHASLMTFWQSYHPPLRWWGSNWRETMAHFIQNKMSLVAFGFHLGERLIFQ